MRSRSGGEGVRNYVTKCDKGEGAGLTQCDVTNGERIDKRKILYNRHHTSSGKTALCDGHK